MIDFTNWIMYAYFLGTIGTLVIIVYAIKFVLLWRSKRKAPVSEKEYKAALKDLENKRKIEIDGLKARKIEEKKMVKLKISKLVPEETKEPDNTRDFSLLKSKSKFSIAYWKHWFIEKYFPAKCVLINMELVNGFHRLFIAVEKEGGFKFRDKKYIFDDDSKYYNMDTKLYVFDYHESIALPIKRKIPVTAIKKTIESTEDIDIEYAINPSTLQRFMTAKIAEGVMKGTMLDEFLRQLKMFIIVIMVTVVAHLALFLYASGILENIKLPF